MISYNEYLKKILSQTLDSYNILRGIQDKPGDLDNINKEMLKINGFIKVVTNNIDQKKIPLNDLKILQSKFSQYLENYFPVIRTEYCKSYSMVQFRVRILVGQHYNSSIN